MQNTFDDINAMKQRGINFLLVNNEVSISYRQQIEFLPTFLLRLNLHMNVDLDESISKFRHLKCVTSQQLH